MPGWMPLSGLPSLRTALGCSPWLQWPLRHLPSPLPLPLTSVSEFNQRSLNNVSVIPRLVKDSSVILLPLRPASLTHKNPQRRKIIRGMRPVGRKE